MRSSPTGRHIRLGTELRKLREAAGLTSTQVSRLLGVRQNQVSNLEAGRAGVSPERIRALADHYGCEDRTLVEALGAMATERTRGWWEEYRGTLPTCLLDLAEVEHHATGLRAVVTLHIPGLLQTAEYGREVFRQDVPRMPPHEIEHRVSFRVKRQAVLFGDSPTPHRVVIHEAALHTRLGSPSVIRDQLRHLVEMSEQDHIAVRVLTFDAGSLPGSGQPFYYSSGPVPQLDTVHLDQSHGPVFLDAPAQLHKYDALLDRLESNALPATTSRDLIHKIAQEV
ncbi:MULTISPECIES: helix-turn-helix domain-containing protein [unclassified Streptomyces]|uniref:helix-turn-helix domain-containing protein n=1 Tax=unclassified Streptomyces TaxID=2593676 RepID=UPI001904B116|nr:helix-turn-helix transcriptional regulator [Streptomyces sp. HSG2]